MMNNERSVACSWRRLAARKLIGLAAGLAVVVGSGGIAEAGSPNPLFPPQNGPTWRAYPHPAYAAHRRTTEFPRSPSWKEAVARHQQDALPLAAYLKVVAPPGTRVVFFASDASEHVRPAPVTAGVRARHRYAFAIENTPNAPNRRYYGTIEVLRGPRLPEGVDGTESPIPVNFTEMDCLALGKDQMLTKIIVLEDPTLAFGVETDPDEPILYDSTLSPNAIETAKSLGKMVLVVRIGDRIPMKEELVGVTVAGSLVLPKKEDPNAYVFVDGVNQEILQTAYHGKSKAISRPPIATAPEQCNLGPGMAGDEFPSVACPPGGCPPGVNSPGWPYVDRFYGEYLCDGGDLGLKADRNQFNVLVNVDPSDTVAEYRDNFNKHRVVESNRVCVYSPRYVEVRFVKMVEGFKVERFAEYVARDRTMDTYVNKVRGIQAEHLLQPQAVRMRQRASGYVREQWAGGYTEVRVLEGLGVNIGIGVEGTLEGPEVAVANQQAYLAKLNQFAVELTREQFPQVFARLQGLGQIVMVWRHQEIVAIEEREGLARLKLEKSASKTEAKIGETVTFQIKYTNIGDETLNNVAVVDSLLSRLQYVDASAQSDRDAVFTAEENEVGSHVLRWEIKGPLKSGESGTVTFQAKIR